MSYAIAYVIYGVPLTDKIAKVIEEWEDEGDERYYNDDDTECGFYRDLYRSDGFKPGYCGILLGEFDEACDFVDVAKLPPKPSKAQMAVAKAMVKGLDPHLLKMCEPVGLYYVWGSS